MSIHQGLDDGAERTGGGSDGIQVRPSYCTFKAHMSTLAGAVCTDAGFAVCPDMLSSTDTVLAVQERWQQAGTGPRAPAAANEEALQRDAERLTAALQAAARGTRARTPFMRPGLSVQCWGQKCWVVLQEGLRAW